MDYVFKGFWVVFVKIRVGNEFYNYMFVICFCFVKKKVF